MTKRTYTEKDAQQNTGLQVSSQQPIGTDENIRRWLSWIIEIATVMLTAPATWRLLAGHGLIEQIAGVVCIEVVFLAFWEWSKRPTKDVAARAYRMIGLAVMYAVLLWVGFRVDGWGAWPPRVAAGLWISHEIVPFVTGWLRDRHEANTTERGLERHEEKKAVKAHKKAIDSAWDENATELADLHKKRVRRNILGDAEFAEQKQGRTLGGKTTCKIALLDGGLARADCTLCDWKSKVHPNAISAGRSGSGHSKVHLVPVIVEG